MSDAPDYKATTNLPRTDFAMKANLPTTEPKRVAAWQQDDTYARALAAAQGPAFTLHDGPPYANGHIHQGHMLNKVLKDFVGKVQTMSGRPAKIFPGWDCHGLPIELAVDKELGSKKRDMSKVAIRKACRAHAQKFIDIQREEFQRLGVFMAWAEPYTTMAYGYEARIVRELAKVVRAGAVYRGKKPVYWCIVDRTALAEAEVEYDDHDSPSVYVAFPLTAGLGKVLPALGDRPVDLAIWTTTPWTLPANLAIAVHPTFQYLVYELRGRPTVVASDLLISFLAAVAPGDLVEAKRQVGGTRLDSASLTHPERILGYVEGRALEGLQYRHPLVDRTSPVILGDHVTLEAGTGLVHTAPGHGQDDYAVGKRYGLAPFAPVDAAGHFTEEAGAPWSGQQIFHANPAIVAALADKGALLNAPNEHVRHSYPHCWRCKKPVIFRATDQWFISMDATSLRQRALAAIEDVEWIPAWGHDRIQGMLQGRPDWCISRQRAWGVPIPAFYCEGCGESLLDPALLDRVADRFETEGADAWFERPAADFMPAGQRCPKCQADRFRKEEDILDVWFDSGVSHAAVLDARGVTLPADLYLEGSDQHRGWFQSSLLCNLAAGRAGSPFRRCLTHGFVVDEKGQKLSKSLGNYIDPQKLLAQHGAEIVRLWAAASNYEQDVPLSEGIMKQLAESYRKIRNTLRFALGNLSDFDPGKDRVPAGELPVLDRYFRSVLHGFLGRVREAYAKHNFNQVHHEAAYLCSTTLSALYFDILKDRLYCSGPKDVERRAAQTVLHEIVDLLCRALAPILSFTCEEAYAFLPGHRESVFVAGLPPVDAAALDEKLEAQMAGVLGVRAEVQKRLEDLRREKTIGSSLEARVSLAAAEPLEAFQRLGGSLEELFIVSQVELAPELRVERAAGRRCERCWKHLPEVPENPPLCRRCARVVQEFSSRQPS
ncbi:MAG TPA: isoleucine--tRNA ligase [Myxococcales bacterium]|nr:isoleucine--tRNA ligase [Myxococcales bacterium]